MNTEPTLEEIRKLVSFKRNDNGKWQVRSVYDADVHNVYGYVHNVYGDVSNVYGNVSNVNGSVHGNVKGYVRDAEVDSSALLAKINVAVAKKRAHLRKQRKETKDHYHLLKCTHKQEGIEWAFDTIESILNNNNSCL